MTIEVETSAMKTKQIIVFNITKIIIGAHF